MVNRSPFLKRLCNKLLVDCYSKLIFNFSSALQQFSIALPFSSFVYVTGTIHINIVTQISNAADVMYIWCLAEANLPAHNNAYKAGIDRRVALAKLIMEYQLNGWTNKEQFQIYICKYLEPSCTVVVR